MHLRLLEPAFLWLLPLILLLWRWPRPIGGARRAFVLRALALALVIVALARPVVSTRHSGGDLVVVLDASASVDDAVPVERFAAAAKAAEHAHLVRFGAATPLAKEATAEFDSVIDLGVAGDLSSALACAAALVPSGVPAGVVVASDGLDESQGFGAAAEALTERGIATSYVALSSHDFGTRPTSIETVGTLRAGHTARVRVRGFGAPSEVQLSTGGAVLATATPNTDGARFDVLLEFEVPLVEALELVARAGGGATSTLVAVQDPLPLLHIGARTLGGSEALANLLGPGFAVRPYGGDLAGGDDAGDLLAQFERELDQAPLVVIDDAPADHLPPGALESLAKAVQDRGVGLVMAGGSAAFGPGGYAGTAIEDALPVDFVQREEKRDPSTTLVVIIDTSGSMGGERVQLAKEVARLAIQRLLPHDKVGIVEFYGAKRWAAPIQPASNHIELERALNRLDAGGGTVIMPAIEEAFYGLQNIETRYKHVLVLTDGGVERGAFEPLLRRMAEKGITISTVLVGGSLHSEFLVDIANWGKGRFYSVPNRFNLPEILLKQPTSAQLPSYRTGAYEIESHGGPVWWGGERPDAIPPVDGYVETELKSGAEAILSVAETGQPLLASWMWGAGRTGALTTEPTGLGTQPWSTWSDYGRFFGRFLARCAAPSDGPFDFTCTRSGYEVCVVAVARFATDRVPAFASAPGGPTIGTPVFERVATDRYEARFIAGDPAQVLALGQREPGGAVEPSVRLVAPPRRIAEADVEPRDRLRLDRLAAATAGTNLSEGGDAPFASREESSALQRLAPLLVLLALLVHLVDVLLRRLAPRNTPNQSVRP